jgi:hypothetical protein
MLLRVCCYAGVIAGLIMHVFVKFFTFKLFKFQRNWPGGVRLQLQAGQQHAAASNSNSTYTAAAYRQLSLVPSAALQEDFTLLSPVQTMDLRCVDTYDCVVWQIMLRLLLLLLLLLLLFLQVLVCTAVGAPTSLCSPASQVGAEKWQKP